MNRRTLATWGVLAAVIAAITVVESTGMLGHGGGESHQEASHQDAGEVRFLVPVPVGTLGAIEITFEGDVYRFERDATDAWLHHRHAPGVVTSGRPPGIEAMSWPPETARTRPVLRDRTEPSRGGASS